MFLRADKLQSVKLLLRGNIFPKMFSLVFLIEKFVINVPNN